MQRFAIVPLAAIALLAALTVPRVRAQESVIHSFGSASDGNTPRANLIVDSKGNLYGTTYSGGADGSGTVFALSPSSTGIWSEKVLHSFSNTGSDGIEPLSGLVFDAQGNLYGTTADGGVNFLGTVFELSPAANGAWTEKILYSFGATNSDGANPSAGLAIDSKGNLYGTTASGGAYSNGTAFELSRSANGSWSETAVYDFGASTDDGTRPNAAPILDSKGNLYGTTTGGGEHAIDGYGSGTVFELVPGTAKNWTEKVLYSFGASSADGSDPVAGVIFDASGNLYGTTQFGGAAQGSGGTAFELSPSGASWKEKILHSFPLYVATDGGAPQAGLVFDARGNLYGTTENYGAFGIGGIVFQLTPAANGTWTETILHSFDEFAADAGAPMASLVFDSTGTLYGTSYYGGGLGTGAVFQIANVNRVATPTFSIAAGHYAKPQTLTMTDATAGATVYYTTNGDDPSTESTKYTAPLNVTGSETVKAMATAPEQPKSQVATASYIVGARVAEPTFSLAAGTYNDAQTLSLADATPGSVIHYTFNGTAPTASSPAYSARLAVSKDATIEAIALAAGYIDSQVESRTYAIAAAKPVFSVAAGKYTSVQTVKISAATAGAAIHYTTNGAAPSAASAKYSAPVAVRVTETLKAVAIAPGYAPSPTASAAYTIAIPTPTPSISPATGTYTSAQTVKIADSNPKAVVYYTTNGATPTTASTVYTKPFTVAANKTETIQAIALAPGDVPSAVAKAVIKIPAPVATPAATPKPGA